MATRRSSRQSARAAAAKMAALMADEGDDANADAKEANDDSSVPDDNLDDEYDVAPRSSGKANAKKRGSAGGSQRLAKARKDMLSAEDCACLTLINAQTAAALRASKAKVPAAPPNPLATTADFWARTFCIRCPRSTVQYQHQTHS